MRALTLWQPWAGFIAAGMKRIETRSWPTSYRGEIAIHAGMVDVGNGLGRMDCRGWGLDLCDPVNQLARLDTTGKFRTRGAVLAVATLTDCMRTQDLVCLDERERLLGNYEPGRWAWRLEHVIALDNPVPCRGKQGLWTLDEETYEAVCDQTLPF